jgi:3-methyladenine DNA glycosylase AlkC
MENESAFKHWINDAALESIAEALTALHPPFPASEFRTRAAVGLEDLELKDRVRQVIGVLAETLPADFAEVAPILRGLPGVWQPNNEFVAWPLVDFVGEHGVGDPDLALEVLKTLTPLFSAEFAIRPFLIEHRDLTLETVARWTRDPSEHVRRLVSEGTRPRLPWGIRLKDFVADPSPVLPLLEALKDDESEYVRRSVANNLNDIAKDHVDVVLETCRAWLPGADANRQRLIAHACRTLVKRGHPEVFPLLGYTENPELELVELVWPKEGLRIGAKGVFEAELRNGSGRTQRVVVDFALSYRKAKGQISPKVFKMGNVTIEPGETRRLRKTLSFEDKTIRTHYPGEHRFSLLVNGTSIRDVAFDLSAGT